jgi:hypothetical protein
VRQDKNNLENVCKHLPAVGIVSELELLNIVDHGNHYWKAFGFKALYQVSHKGDAIVIHACIARLVDNGDFNVLENQVVMELLVVDEDVRGCHDLAY